MARKSGSPSSSGWLRLAALLCSDGFLGAGIPLISRMLYSLRADWLEGAESSCSKRDLAGSRASSLLYTSKVYSERGTGLWLLWYIDVLASHYWSVASPLIVALMPTI